MAALSARERRFLSAVSRLGYCNPFLTERLQLEKEVLGGEFVDDGPVWRAQAADPEATRPNVGAIQRKLERAVPEVQGRLAGSADVSEEEFRVYEESVHYLLYQRYYPRFTGDAGGWRFYRDFLADWNRLLRVGGKRVESTLDPAHVFACFRQIQNAFHHIYDNILGGSMPAARLRASVWQSIFTHDMRRYRRFLYSKMGEFPTLITGPSGTGKELVARAIAGSRYVAFDAHRMAFDDARLASFLPVNVAALSAALVESELFGHRRGAFTGAIADRKGWLEACPPQGAVFLDELGELDPAIQVKLLRVLETRTFSAVGEHVAREFRGKLIAATNRDLGAETRTGRFREDLYYRLCADLIRTPSLAEQIAESPGVLGELVEYMTGRTVGHGEPGCVAEVARWIEANLPRDYAWPGNYRELEQCVRNLVIRGTYRPLERAADEGGGEFHSRFNAGRLTAEEVLSHYARIVYRLTGSYEEAARRMEVDRRTVKAKVLAG